MSEAHVSAQQPQTGQAARISTPDVDTRGTGDRAGAAAQGPPPSLGLSPPLLCAVSLPSASRVGRLRGRRHSSLTVSAESWGASGSAFGRSLGARH